MQKPQLHDHDIALVQSPESKLRFTLLALHKYDGRLLDLESLLSRFLGDPLGPTIMTIKPGSAQKVLAVLAELGYLGEIRGDVCEK